MHVRHADQFAACATWQIDIRLTGLSLLIGQAFGG